MVSHFSLLSNRSSKPSEKMGDKKAWAYSLALHVLLFAGMVSFAIFQGPKPSMHLQSFDLMNADGGGGSSGGGDGGFKMSTLLPMGPPLGQPGGGQGGGAPAKMPVIEEKDLQGKHSVKFLPLDSAKQPSEKEMDVAAIKAEEVKRVPEKVIPHKRSKALEKVVPKKLQKHAVDEHKIAKNRQKLFIEAQKKVFKEPKKMFVRPPEKMSYQEFIKKHGRPTRLIKKKSVARARSPIKIPTIKVKSGQREQGEFGEEDSAMGVRQTKVLRQTGHGMSAHRMAGARELRTDKLGGNGELRGNGGVPGGVRNGLVGGVVGGMGAGSGGGLVGSAMGGGRGEGEGSIFQAYLVNVRNLVEQAWKKPPIRMHKKLVGVVEFTVDEFGRCHRSQIFESSGNALFDASILDAFKALQRFPRPPNQKTCTFRLTFEQTL